MKGYTDRRFGTNFKGESRDPRTADLILIFKGESRDQRTADLILISKAGLRDPRTADSVGNFEREMKGSTDRRFCTNF